MRVTIDYIEQVGGCDYALSRSFTSPAALWGFLAALGEHGAVLTGGCIELAQKPAKPSDSPQSKEKGVAVVRQP